MKLPLASVILATLGLLSPGSLRAETAAAAPAYPPHTVAGTELRVLPRTRSDRLYQLHIALPASFHEHPRRKYPVVFVTDGYWDFTTVVATMGNLTYGKNLPEMIVVGLGYAGENLDYNDLRVDDLSPLQLNGHGGHAAEFLGLIETVAIPLLEKEYRADPAHRYLMGCSLGGLFSLYAMLTKPALFQGYVADSPAVEYLWNFERAFVAAGRTADARVYIAMAENDESSFRQIGVDFYRALKADGIVQGGLMYRTNADVRHAGGKPLTYTQGLLYVATPIAPETGASPDWGRKGRPHFVVNFRPAVAPAGVAPTPASEELLRTHAAFLDRLVADKQAGGVGRTPPGLNLNYSMVTVSAPNRVAVEALVRTDPAVQAGVLSFDIVQAED